MSDFALRQAPDPVNTITLCREFGSKYNANGGRADRPAHAAAFSRRVFGKDSRCLKACAAFLFWRSMIAPLPETEGVGGAVIVRQCLNVLDDVLLGGPA